MLKNETGINKISRMLVETEPFLQDLNRKTDGHFEDFLIEHDLCPICLGDLWLIPDEGKVCRKCGFQPMSHVFGLEIPFDEVRVPTNELAFGRNLGGSLQAVGRFFVIAHGANGNKDAPIRSIHLRTLVETHEHPKIKRMLSCASQLAHKFDFDNNQKAMTIDFSNYLGKLIRRIGNFIVAYEISTNLVNVASCCFLLALRKARGNQAFHDGLALLEINPEAMQNVEDLNEFILSIQNSMKNKHAKNVVPLFGKVQELMDRLEKVENHGEVQMS